MTIDVRDLYTKIRLELFGMWDDCDEEHRQTLIEMTKRLNAGEYVNSEEWKFCPECADPWEMPVMHGCGLRACPVLKSLPISPQINSQEKP